MSTASIPAPPTVPIPVTAEQKFIALCDALSIPSDFRLIDRDTYDSTPAHLRQTLTGRGGRMVHVAWNPHDAEADPGVIAAAQPLVALPTWDQVIGLEPVRPSLADELLGGGR